MLSAVGTTPNEADYRRAISNAYYGLFHKLVDESLALFCPVSPPALAATVRRGFQHTAMREVCKSVSQGRTCQSFGRPEDSHVGPDPAGVDCDRALLCRTTRGSASCRLRIERNDLGDESGYGRSESTRSFHEIGCDKRFGQCQRLSDGLAHVKTMAFDRIRRQRQKPLMLTSPTQEHVYLRFKARAFSLSRSSRAELPKVPRAYLTRGTLGSAGRAGVRATRAPNQPGGVASPHPSASPPPPPQGRGSNEMENIDQPQTHTL